MILFTPTLFLESNYLQENGNTCAFQKLFVCRAGPEGQKEMLMAGAPLLHKRSGQQLPSNLLQSKHRKCQSIKGVFWLGLSNLHPPPNEMMMLFLCSSLNGRDESCLFINLTKVLVMLIVCVQFTKVAEHLLSTVDDSSRSFRTNAAIHEWAFSWMSHSQT